MKSSIAYYIGAVVCITSIVGCAHAYAQTATSNSFSSTVSKFKGEQAVIQRGGSTFAQQQRFIQAAIQVFIQRAVQVQTIVQEDKTVLEKNKKDELLTRITENLVALRGYYNEAGLAQTLEELKTIAIQVTAQRTTVGQEIRRAMLEFYVSYFQKTAQQKIMTRYQDIQTGLLNAKNTGKDTSIAEKLLRPAGSMMEQVDEIIAQIQTMLTDTKKEISLDDIERALEKVQKNISAIYDIFRKITIQGSMLLELNKEEKGIQNTLPMGNL